jgi:putative endonuclease
MQQIVYLLLCNDGTYYTGCTNNLEGRIGRHQKGYVESTKHKLPVQIVFHCVFSDKTKAFEFEKYLKSGSGIAFRNKHLI